MLLATLMLNSAALCVIPYVLLNRSLCTFEGKLQGVAAETLNKNIVLERWMEGLLLYAGLEVNPMQFIEILSSGCESNELAADEVNASRVAAMIEDRFGGSFKNKGSQNGSELPSSKIEDLAEAHATIALLRKGHYLKELEEEGVFNAFSMDERELHRRRASQETLASENEPDCLSLEEKVKDLMQQLTRKEALYQEILRECDAVTVEAVHWEEKYLLHTDEAMKASETIRALQEKLQQVHGIMTDQDEVVEELCEEIEERKDELELAKAQMEELQSSLMFTTKVFTRSIVHFDTDNKCCIL